MPGRVYTRDAFLRSYRELHPEYSRVSDPELFRSLETAYPKIREHISDLDINTSMPEGWLGNPTEKPLDQTDAGREYLKLRNQSKRGFSDAVSDVIDTSNIPILGDYLDAAAIGRNVLTLQKLKRGETLSDEELIRLNTWKLTEERLADSSGGAKVVDIVAGSAKFAAEIGLAYATAGQGLTASIASKAAKKAGKEAAEELLELAGRKGLSKFARTRLKAAARVKAVEAGRRALVNRMASGIEKRLIRVGGLKMANRASLRLGARALAHGTYAGVTGLGLSLNPVMWGKSLSGAQRNRLQRTLRGEDGVEVTDSLFAGWADTATELVTELSGRALVSGAGAVLNTARVKAAANTAREFGKTIGGMIDNAAPAPFLQKARVAAGVLNKVAFQKGLTGSVGRAREVIRSLGVGGAVEEMAEERMGDFMRGLFGLQGDGPGFRNAMTQVLQSVTDLEQMSVEGIAFIVPGTVMHAYRKAQDVASELKDTSGTTAKFNREYRTAEENWDRLLRLDPETPFTEQLKFLNRRFGKDSPLSQQIADAESPIEVRDLLIQERNRQLAEATTGTAVPVDADPTLSPAGKAAVTRKRNRRHRKTAERRARQLNEILGTMDSLANEGELDDITEFGPRNSKPMFLDTIGIEGGFENYVGSLSGVTLKFNRVFLDSGDVLQGVKFRELLGVAKRTGRTNPAAAVTAASRVSAALRDVRITREKEAAAKAARERAEEAAADAAAEVRAREAARPGPSEEDEINRVATDFDDPTGDPAAVNPAAKDKAAVIEPTVPKGPVAPEASSTASDVPSIKLPVLTPRANAGAERSVLVVQGETIEKTANQSQTANPALVFAGAESYPHTSGDELNRIRKNLLDRVNDFDFEIDALPPTADNPYIPRATPDNIAGMPTDEITPAFIFRLWENTVFDPGTLLRMSRPGSKVYAAMQAAGNRKDWWEPDHLHPFEILLGNDSNLTDVVHEMLHVSLPLLPYHSLRMLAAWLKTSHGVTIPSSQLRNPDAWDVKIPGFSDLSAHDLYIRAALAWIANAANAQWVGAVDLKLSPREIEAMSTAEKKATQAPEERDPETADEQEEARKKSARVDFSLYLEKELNRLRVPQEMEEVLDRIFRPLAGMMTRQRARGTKEQKDRYLREESSERGLGIFGSAKTKFRESSLKDVFTSIFLPTGVGTKDFDLTDDEINALSVAEDELAESLEEIFSQNPDGRYLFRDRDPETQEGEDTAEYSARLIARLWSMMSVNLSLAYRKDAADVGRRAEKLVREVQLRGVLQQTAGERGGKIIAYEGDVELTPLSELLVTQVQKKILFSENMATVKSAVSESGATTQTIALDPEDAQNYVDQWLEDDQNLRDLAIRFLGYHFRNFDGGAAIFYGTDVMPESTVENYDEVLIQEFQRYLGAGAAARRVLADANRNIGRLRKEVSRLGVSELEAEQAPGEDDADVTGVPEAEAPAAKTPADVPAAEEAPLTIENLLQILRRLGSTVYRAAQRMFRTAFPEGREQLEASFDRYVETLLPEAATIMKNSYPEISGYIDAFQNYLELELAVKRAVEDLIESPGTGRTAAVLASKIEDFLSPHAFPLIPSREDRRAQVLVYINDRLDLDAAEMLPLRETLLDDLVEQKVRRASRGAGDLTSESVSEILPRALPGTPIIQPGVSRSPIVERGVEGRTSDPGAAKYASATKEELSAPVEMRGFFADLINKYSISEDLSTLPDAVLMERVRELWDAFLEQSGLDDLDVDQALIDGFEFFRTAGAGYDVSMPLPMQTAGAALIFSKMAARLYSERSEKADELEDAAASAYSWLMTAFRQAGQASRTAQLTYQAPPQLLYRTVNRAVDEARTEYFSKNLALKAVHDAGMRVVEEKISGNVVTREDIDQMVDDIISQVQDETPGDRRRRLDRERKRRKKELQDTETPDEGSPVAASRAQSRMADDLFSSMTGFNQRAVSALVELTRAGKKKVRTSASMNPDSSLEAQVTKYLESLEKDMIATPDQTLDEFAREGAQGLAQLLTEQSDLDEQTAQDAARVWVDDMIATYRANLIRVIAEHISAFDLSFEAIFSETAKKSLNTADAEGVVLGEQLDRLTKELTEAYQQRNQLLMDRMQLKSDLQFAQSTTVDLQDKIARLEQAEMDTRALEAELTTVSAGYEALQTEYNRVSAEAQALLQRVAQLKDQLSKSQINHANLMQTAVEEIAKAAASGQLRMPSISPEAAERPGDDELDEAANALARRIYGTVLPPKQRLRFKNELVDVLMRAIKIRLPIKNPAARYNVYQLIDLAFAEKGNAETILQQAVEQVVASIGGVSTELLDEYRGSGGLIPMSELVNVMKKNLPDEAVAQLEEFTELLASYGAGFQVLESGEIRLRMALESGSALLPDLVLNRSINDILSEMKVRLRDLAGDLINRQEGSLNFIVGEIIGRTHLDGPQATELALRLHGILLDRVTAAKITALNTFVSQGERLRDSRDLKRAGGWVRRMLDILYTGAFDEELGTPEMREAWETEFGKRFRIPTFTPELRKTLQEFARKTAREAESSYHSFYGKRDLDNMGPEEVAKIDEIRYKLYLNSEAHRQFFENVSREIALANSVGYGDLGVALFYANALSGFSTQELNFIATAANSLGVLWNTGYSGVLKARKQGVDTKRAWTRAVEQFPTFAGQLIFSLKNILVPFSLQQNRIPGARVAGSQLGRGNPTTLELNPFQHKFGSNVLTRNIDRLRYIMRLMIGSDFAYSRATGSATLQRLLQTQAEALGMSEEAGNLWAAVNMFGHRDYDMTEEADRFRLEADLKNLDNLTDEQRKTFANRLVLVEQAHQDAVNVGLTPGTMEYRLRVEETLFNLLPDEITEEVQLISGRATYNVLEHDPIFSSRHRPLAKLRDKLVEMKQDSMTATAIFPFVHIVTQVLNTGIDWTPGLGHRHLAKATAEFNAGEKGDDAYTEEDLYYLQAQTQTGILLFSALGLALLAAYFADPEDPIISVTGSGPSNLRLKNQLRENGYQEYTLKIGDNHLNYHMSPLAAPLVIIGSFMDSVRYEDNTGKSAAVPLFQTLVRSVGAWTDQSYLSNFADLISALTSPNLKTATREMSNVLTRTFSTVFVPNAARQISRMFNPVLYEAPDGLLQTVLREIPCPIPMPFGKVRPRVNALGEDIILGQSSIVTSILSAPLRPGKRLGRLASFDTQPEDSIWSYFARKRLLIPTVTRATTLRGVPMTSDQLYTYAKDRGKVLRQWLDERVTDERWKILTPDEQQKDVNRLARKAGALSRAAMTGGTRLQSIPEVPEF